MQILKAKNPVNTGFFKHFKIFLNRVKLHLKNTETHEF